MDVLAKLRAKYGEPTDMPNGPPFVWEDPLNPIELTYYTGTYGWGKPDDSGIHPVSADLNGLQGGGVLLEVRISDPSLKDKAAPAAPVKKDELNF